MVQSSIGCIALHAPSLDAVALALAAVLNNPRDLNRTWVYSSALSGRTIGGARRGCTRIARLAVPSSSG